MLNTKNTEVLSLRMQLDLYCMARSCKYTGPVEGEQALLQPQQGAKSEHGFGKGQSYI